MRPDLGLAQDRDMLFANPLEPIVLRESLRARTAVAPASMLATITLNLLYIPFFLLHNVPYTRILLFSPALILLITARGFFARYVIRDLDQYDEAQMNRADRILRVSSILNQFTVGMGVWIVRAPGDDSMAAALFMTLLMVTWSIGAMANLFSDYRSFILSMPIMIGLNALFWLTHSLIGITIGLSLIFASMFMVFLARTGSRTFRESILIRFEKDELLRKLEGERENTERALREAQAANESKAFFMAAASHDIKQPLHALALLTDTLLMTNPPESALPLLRSQRESISRMTEHFDALMDMGRFEGGRFELSITRFSLGRFAARIDAEIAPLCAEKGLAWMLNLDDVMVSTDEELLLRAMRNLLNNAVRFTDAGEVRCIARRRGEHVDFTVSDTGCGIAPEFHEVVFQEFIRLPQEGSRTTGAGLGLSIVAKINQALGLNLQMSSVPGRGTEFRFTLPLATGRETPLPTRDPALAT